MRLQVEITTFCNADCEHCEHTYWNEKPKNMSFEDFKLIIDACSPEHIDLSGIGENSCNPDWLKILEYSCQKVASVEFTCNLLNVEKEVYKPVLEIIKKYKPRINCSINSRDFNYLKEAIVILNDLTNISINYVVTSENVCDAEKTIKELIKLKINDIQFINVDVFEDTTHLQTSDNDLNKISDLIKKYKLNASISNINPQPPCGNFFITVDGHILPSSSITQSKDRTALIDTYSNQNIICRIKSVLELMEFTGDSMERVNEKVMKAPDILNTEWFMKNPVSDEEIKKFYRETEYMIYDLMGWSRPRWVEKINKYYKQDMFVLDYGCGVGDFIIGLSKDKSIVRLGGSGSNFHALDIKDSLTQKFASWRFKRRGLNPKWVEEPERKYDMIICLDVFEHVKDPIELLMKLYKNLNKDGFLILSLGFHDNRPLHVSHNELEFRKQLEIYFTKVEDGRPEVWKK